MQLRTRWLPIPRLGRHRLEVLVAVLAGLIFLLLLIAFLTARTVAAF